MTRRYGTLSRMEPIVTARLQNQLLGSASSPAEVVAEMGAIQAQDYAGAKWALGLRARGTTEVAVEAALDRGEILRTHPMRGTHHFVAPSDIRWLLELIAPRSLAKVAYRHRSLGLDAATLAAAMKALARALEGGSHLVRAEIADVLTRAGVSPEGQRLPHIIMHAEVTGLVCSGKRRGKQITVALLDGRAPRHPTLDRESALGELARRYFTTRGPATVRDFVWWSSLTAAEARKGIAAAAGLRREVIDGIEYWRGVERRRGRVARAHLLPPFDEYTVAYQDREAAGVAPAKVASAGERWLLAPNVILDGKVVGVWKRAVTGGVVNVSVKAWRKLRRDEVAAIAAAAEAHSTFLGLEARVIAT